MKHKKIELDFVDYFYVVAFIYILLVGALSYFGLSK